MLRTILLKLGVFFMVSMSNGLSGSLSTPFATDIHAVIFDCDGVLVDTEYLKFLAWQEALASTGVELSMEEYKAVAGHSSKKILELLKGMKHLDISEKVIEFRRAKYQELQAKGVPPLPETIEFARYLAKNKSALDLKLGLASSAPTSEILLNLKQIGLEHDFDVIVSGSDDLDSYSDKEGKNKPKPYIYLEAAKRLHVAPARCLVLEDTEAGIEAAVSAGMVAVAIPNWITEEQNFSKASQMIHSISELRMQISKDL